MKSVTPLLRFLRAMEPDQKKAFAADVSEIRRRMERAAGHPAEGHKVIKVLYLTQLACMDGSPNPNLLTAMPIVEASKKWSHLLLQPPLTFEDLLVPTTEDGVPVTTALRIRKSKANGESSPA